MNRAWERRREGVRADTERKRIYGRLHDPLRGWRRSEWGWGPRSVIVLTRAQKYAAMLEIAELGSDEPLTYAQHRAVRAGVARKRREF